MVKVREFENFQKSSLLKGSEKYNFYELQAVCGQEHYITNANDLRGLFKTKSAKIKYLYRILKLLIDVILSCKWLLLAFKKGLEKRSRVREKSVKSQGILIWKMSGNPVGFRFISLE